MDIKVDNMAARPQVYDERKLDNQDGLFVGYQLYDKKEQEKEDGLSASFEVNGEAVWSGY